MAELVRNSRHISHVMANSLPQCSLGGDVLKHKLKTVPAWLSREDVQRFWEYSFPAWAGKVLDEWTNRTMRTRLQPLLSVAEMLHRHMPLLLNWFQSRAEFSAGCVEGMNGKARLTMKNAYGFSRSMWRKSHCCIHLGSCRPQKSPTDSGAEAKS